MTDFSAEGPRNGDESLLISIQEVALILGISSRTVRRLISRREFPGPGHIGRSSKWLRADVNAWVKRRFPGTLGQEGS
ncbi:helix-turn-helix transcriptional regulator [Anatilimnocola floriformis]|uniref:helix-turn-helix transcriptional regulator n=1 Tax=Anatilimnocola floriformis TaxID=2948575 RepID=UPI0036F2CB76